MDNSEWMAAKIGFSPRSDSEIFTVHSFDSFFLNEFFNRCPDITDDGFPSFAEALKHLVTLQQLQFYFQKCSKITDSGVFILSEGLKELTDLQLVDLNFGESFLILNSLFNIFIRSQGVTETGVSVLKESLKGLNSLKKLNVYFFSWKF